ncbi:MAG: hypothetical protein ACI9MB_001376 [Verrucomicrobiales bacterium]|jgi:hypothetical protein
MHPRRSAPDSQLRRLTKASFAAGAGVTSICNRSPMPKPLSTTASIANRSYGRSKLELKLTPMAILGSSDRLSKRKPRRLRQIISIESHFRSHTIILVPAASCDEFPSLVIRANSSRSSSAPSDEIFVYTSNCPGTDILRSRSSSTDRPATSAASALRSKTPSPYRSATFEEIAVSLSSSTPRAPSADPPVFPRIPPESPTIPKHKPNAQADDDH